VCCRPEDRHIPYSCQYRDLRSEGISCSCDSRLVIQGESGGGSEEIWAPMHRSIINRGQPDGFRCLGGVDVMHPRKAFFSPPRPSLPGSGQLCSSSGPGFCNCSLGHSPTVGTSLQIPSDLPSISRKAQPITNAADHKCSRMTPQSLHDLHR
jgi:hypothetical protein